MEISYIPLSNNVPGRLYLGGWTDYDEPELVDKLLRKKIDLVIGLGFKRHPLNKYRTNIDIICYDIRDSPDKYDVDFMEDIIRECVDEIDKALMDGENVYIHCKMGISRSATLVIAYLMKYENMSFREALDYLRKYRPIVNPNKGFRELLKNMEKEYLN